MTSTKAGATPMLRKQHRGISGQPDRYPGSARYLRRRESDGRNGWKAQARMAVAAAKKVTV
jgi:hypothetical protein